MKELDLRFPRRAGTGVDINAGGNRAGLGGLFGGQAPVVLRRASFGEARGYAKTGGLRVLSDDCPAAEPLDLAQRGLDFSGAPQARSALLAAFVCGPGRAPAVKVWLACVGELASGHLRARCGDEARTRPALVVFGPDRTAEAELAVINVPLDCVRTVDEQWTWEWCDLDSDTFHTLGGLTNAVAVRIYVTAGVYCSSAPRESYYHIACAVPGAADRAQARLDVWHRFTDMHHGRSLTNARGRALTLWCDQSPALGPTPYNHRGARSLITLGDSSCQGWAELLHEAWAIHGIASTVTVVQPRLASVAAQFHVPRVAVPGDAGALRPVTGLGLMVRPYRWAPTPVPAPQPQEDDTPIEFGDFRWKLDDPMSLCGTHWEATDVQDLGRSTPSLHDPRQKCGGAFSDHAAVVFRDGDAEHWHDPTFGLGPFDSLAEYEGELLGKGRTDCGGVFAVVGCRYLWQTDPATGRQQPVDIAWLRLAAMPAPREPILEAVPPTEQEP